MIVGALAVAVGLALLQGMWRFGEIALESPLFVAGYLAVVGIGYLAWRGFAHVWRSRRRLPPIPAQPIPAEPSPAEPSPAEPISAEPISAEPISAQPTLAGPALGRVSRVPENRTEELALIGGGILFGGGGAFVVVDAWGYGIRSISPVIMGVLAVLLGVLCFWAGIVHLFTRAQRRQDALAESSRDLIRDHALRADRRDVARLRDLLRALADPETVGAAALAELSTCPGLLDGLSFRARHAELTSELKPFVDAVTAAEPQPDLSLAAALASLDRNGHAREAAVAVMAADPSPVNAWFLAERTADPVEPVRLRALAALGALAAADPPTYAPVVQQAAARLGHRPCATAIRTLADAEPVERPLVTCCRPWPERPCFPVHREQLAAAQTRADR
ncbi:hypothetical protein [Actinoplanes sp. NPDC049118]|uniref:hypothetical protein n=1 Tax=Actinoplanes sp. NPDC049118 TaxID=3155769 RepID=UPI0033D414C9